MDQRVPVRHAQTARGLDHLFLGRGGREPPHVSAGPVRIAQALATIEVSRVLRTAVRVEVPGVATTTCAIGHSRLATSDESGKTTMRSAALEALRDEIDGGIGPVQIEAYVGVRAEEVGQERRDPARPERHGHGESNESSRTSRELARGTLDLLGFAVDAARGHREIASHFGQRELTRRAVERARSEALFQAGHAARQGGNGNAQGLGCGREGALLGDLANIARPSRGLRNQEPST